MAFKWDYFTFRDGYLYDERNRRLRNTPRFESGAAAEAWLVANDIRGTVR